MHDQWVEILLIMQEQQGRARTSLDRMKSRFHLFQDWKANRGNIKGRLVMVAFRLAHPLQRSPIVQEYQGCARTSLTG
jgi:hypothetical protein